VNLFKVLVHQCSWTGMELTGSMKHICITGYIQYISVSSHPFISRYITGWELPGRNPINRLINCKNTLSFTVHKKQELFVHL